MRTRPVETVNVIEVASVCNLSCVYCPCPKQMEWRDVGLMDMGTYNKALGLVQHFERKGTQGEVCLYMFGEPMLHPRVVDMVRDLRAVLPAYKSVLLSTNGYGMTASTARALHEAGVTVISLSDHEAPLAMRAIIELKKAGVPWRYWRGAIWEPNNYAGLVEWAPAEEVARYGCDWFIKGMVAVMSDGRVTTCCNDAGGWGVIGTVDDPPDTLEMRPFDLCRTCNQVLPPPWEHHQKPEKKEVPA